MLIQDYGVEHQVELINEKVNVAKYFEMAHAGILISNDRLNVKAYPHSLLESLYYKRPVILSKDIPLSLIVEHFQAGISVEPFQVSALQEAVQRLIDRYSDFVQQTGHIPKHLYSTEFFLKNVGDVYNAVTSDSL